jgi:hypothetical protein
VAPASVIGRGPVRLRAKVPARAVDDLRMSEHDIAEIDRPSEADRILDWRFSELRRLGFDRPQARELSESGADLELVRKLVGNGCPTELALRIAL